MMKCELEYMPSRDQAFCKTHQRFEIQCVQAALKDFVAFVRRSHVGHDIEKGCTTGICKEIDRLEKEGLVSQR